MKIKTTKEVFAECFKNLNPKEIFDVGINNGRRSKMFLEKGVNITGIDIKKNKDLPEEINFILSDIRNHVFKEKYDLIIASLVLHFFKREKAEQVINKIKENTLVGGFNMILNMNVEDGFSKGNSEKFYVVEEEIKELYSDWKIVKFGTFETPVEEHSDLPPHSHNLSYVLAKKKK